MRALVIHPGPAFSVSDVHRGWLKGLTQLGVDTAEYALQNRLYFFSEALLDRDGDVRLAFTHAEACRLAMKEAEAACYEWWPDLVVVISGFFLNPFICEVMRARGHKVVLVHTESPYEDDKQLERAQWVDLNVLNDPTNLDKFPDGSIYLPHCYDPDIHLPRHPTPGYDSDFAFVGTGFPSRIEFFEQVDWTGIDATFAGNWQGLTDDSPIRSKLAHPIDECCDNETAAVHYTSTKTSANLYRAEAQRPELSQGWAMGPREVELAACGTWFARQPRGEGDGIFPMLPTFAEPAELGDLIRWALAHPDERQDAALKAREAIRTRTFDVNAAEVLALLYP